MGICPPDFDVMTFGRSDDAFDRPSKLSEVSVTWDLQPCVRWLWYRWTSRRNPAPSAGMGVEQQVEKVAYFLPEAKTPAAHLGPISLRHTASKQAS